jgi:hypothetical protein
MKFRTEKKIFKFIKNIYERDYSDSNIYGLDYTKHRLVKIILHLPKNYKPKPKPKIIIIIGWLTLSPTRFYRV